jgi:hypothetical protein
MFGLSLDKFMHFVVGLAVGSGFWWSLERHARPGVRLVNPLCFLLMLIWGASGLFFFRKLGLPILSHTLFYMAIPDWDIPFYHATRLRFLIHRSWLFHSVLIPMTLLSLWFWLSRILPRTTWKHQLNNLMRDCALGLSVGISAHLIWDALLSYTRRGFYIRGFGWAGSALWLGLNLVVGLGVPLLIVRYSTPRPNVNPD